ncbi:NAD(P)/FAD-dependent oxidoreductase [Actinoalloteichus spitiensis]|uniref:NAD(P)/FAD-dependent oxidoreductase n=1 Tax=Actinoalloteichus spitiensis TaxID=252394 RepID=UPI00037CB712|nr:NAD(P)/FAD-dependent oxidoreductase [Actinoalloteichus spitiensis]
MTERENGSTPHDARAAGGRPRWDAIVIGGGPAGLSGALTLARARRSVLVIDDGRPRNAPAAHAHNYLTRDGAAPGELLDTGRAEVASYGGAFLTGTVVSATRGSGGEFRLTVGDGTVAEGRRLLVATGLVDELPPVPGLRERWGREVLHCPYCHGWEVRDQRIAVLATGPMAVHAALLWRQWSSDVTLVEHTWTGPTPEEAEQLAARGVTRVRGEVTGVRLEEDRLVGVTLAGGRPVDCQALVVAPRFVARTEALEGLGLTTADQEMRGHSIGEHLPADPSGATSVPGVWVAGNVTSLADQIVAAAASGVRAGALINADLVSEDTAEAVRAYGGFTPRRERDVAERVLGAARHGL